MRFTIRHRDGFGSRKDMTQIRERKAKTKVEISSFLVNIRKIDVGRIEPGDETLRINGLGRATRSSWIASKEIIRGLVRRRILEDDVFEKGRYGEILRRVLVL